MSGGIADSRSAKRLRLWYLVIVIAVAAILVFSMLSVLLYRQMQDYHDSKYRSQYVIVSDISTYAQLVDSHVVTMTNTSLTLDDRAIAGTSAVSDLRYLSSLVLAIREMYLADSEKNDTFYALGLAVDTLGVNAETVYDNLLRNLTDGIPMLEHPALNANLGTAAALVGSLSQVLDAGFKEGADFEKHPYSIVSNLDLASIRSISASVINAF
jgi:hypothetical protein